MNADIDIDKSGVVCFKWVTPETSNKSDFEAMAGLVRLLGNDACIESDFSFSHAKKAFQTLLKEMKATGLQPYWWELRAQDSGVFLWGYCSKTKQGGRLRLL